MMIRVDYLVSCSGIFNGLMLIMGATAYRGGYHVIMYLPDLSLYFLFIINTPITFA